MAAHPNTETMVSAQQPGTSVTCMAVLTDTGAMHTVQQVTPLGPPAMLDACTPCEGRAQGTHTCTPAPEAHAAPCKGHSLGLAAAVLLPHTTARRHSILTADVLGYWRVGQELTKGRVCAASTR
jgi:hypothetical protein